MIFFAYLRMKKNETRIYPCPVYVSISMFVRGLNCELISYIKKDFLKFYNGNKSAVICISPVGTI